MRASRLCIVCILAAFFGVSQLRAEQNPTTRAVDGWILPSLDKSPSPIWGIENGLSIGLAPTPGPRGLIRIYAPYLDQPPGRMINFIAIEPIVAGKRSLSEMERSASDGRTGKLISVDGEPLRERSREGAPT